MTTKELLAKTGVPHRRTLYTWVKDGKIGGPSRVYLPGARRAVLDWPETAVTECEALRRPPPTAERRAALVTDHTARLASRVDRLETELTAARELAALVAAWVASKHLPISPPMRDRPYTITASAQRLRDFAAQYQTRVYLGADGQVCLESCPAAP